MPQARAFLKLVSGHRLEALFSLALCLGPRQGEVLVVQWSNLDLEGRTLTIDGALKRIEGKLVKGKTKREASNRTIALPAVTIAALRRHQARHEQERQRAGSRWKEAGYVFTTRIGTPIERRNLLRDWYKIMAASDLPKIRFHDLRHSAATVLFAQGVHPKTVIGDSRAQRAEHHDEDLRSRPGQDEAGCREQGRRRVRPQSGAGSYQPSYQRGFWEGRELTRQGLRP